MYTDLKQARALYVQICAPKAAQPVLKAAMDRCGIKKHLSPAEHRLAHAIPEACCPQPAPDHDRVDIDAWASGLDAAYLEPGDFPRSSGIQLGDGLTRSQSIRMLEDDADSFKAKM